MNSPEDQSKIKVLIKSCLDQDARSYRSADPNDFGIHIASVMRRLTSSRCRSDITGLLLTFEGRDWDCISFDRPDKFLNHDDSNFFIIPKLLNTKAMWTASIIFNFVLHQRHVVIEDHVQIKLMYLWGEIRGQVPIGRINNVLQWKDISPSNPLIPYDQRNLASRESLRNRYQTEFGGQRYRTNLLHSREPEISSRTSTMENS